MRNLILILFQCVFLCAACGEDSSYLDRDTTRDLFPSTKDKSSKPCNTTYCSTCCIEEACVKTTTRTACGLGGNPCKRCEPGEDCKDGECLNIECTSTNCKEGCCSSELGGCQKGTLKEACGRGAITCKKCTGDDLCINGKCAPRSSNSYKIILKSATILEDTECSYFGLWDDCDPKVYLFLGDATDEPSAKSEAQMDTYQPVWNEELVTASSADILQQFSIEILDHDDLSDDSLSKCTWKLTEDDLASGSVVNHCGTYVQDLKFEFQAQ